MEIFTAFAGELERSIAWGSGGFTTLGGEVARVQRNRSALASLSNIIDVLTLVRKPLLITNHRKDNF